MTNPIDPAFLELQQEYLASMPERLAELRSDIAQFRAGTAGADASLRIRLHRLAGSGGSYGFVDLSSIARDAERWLAAHPLPAEADQLEAQVERLARAVEEAGKRISGEAGEAGEAGKRGSGEAGQETTKGPQLN